MISQRLVARNCPSCLVKDTIKKGVLDSLAEEFGKELVAGLLSGKVEARKGKGCPECSGTGFKGRVGIFEVLKIDEQLRKLIFEKASIQILLEQARKEGFKLMVEDGLEKVAAGIITIEEVLQAVRE